ncbi:hypothetical protein XENOCAPTIV_002776, partial [Xenoophorus captivus]
IIVKITSGIGRSVPVHLQHICQTGSAHDVASPKNQAVDQREESLNPGCDSDNSNRLPLTRSQLIAAAFWCPWKNPTENEAFSYEPQLQATPKSNSLLQVNVSKWDRIH